MLDLKYLLTELSLIDGALSTMHNTTRPDVFVGKHQTRFRNRRAEKQPSYVMATVDVFVAARHISRSKYTPHIGKKRGG